MARKRENGSGSIRKRKDGLWEARYSVGTHPGTGKLIRKSVYGKTKNEVAEKLRAITASIDSNEYIEVKDATLKEWFNTWLDEFNKDSKPLTIQQYRSMLETHVYPALGAVKLSELSSMQLQKFFNQLAIDGKTVKRFNKETGKTETYKEPLSAKTINNIFHIVSAGMKSATEQEPPIIKRNICKSVRIPKFERKPKLAFTDEQEKAFLNAIEAHRFKNIYIVLLYSGIRESEAVGLTWDCVDFNNGKLIIDKQLQRVPGKWSEWKPVKPKSGRAREVYVPKKVIDTLKEQQAKQYKARFDAKDAWDGFQNMEESKTWYVFTDDLGRHLNSSTVYENFKRIAAQIGFPDANVHTLRHTFITDYQKMGIDIATVQAQAGHSSAKTTLDYVDVQSSMKANAAEKLQQRIIQKNA